MAEFYLNVGDEVVQERLVTAAAIDAFAEVSGDLVCIGEHVLKWVVA